MDREAIRVLEQLAAAVGDGGTIIIQLTTKIPLPRRLRRDRASTQRCGG
jgi:hypothetical protein